MELSEQELEEAEKQVIPFKWHGNWSKESLTEILVKIIARINRIEEKLSYLEMKQSKTKIRKRPEEY